jgi:hypothetical protein|tara:strand:+ start:27997 stop:28905 length:909 start_codon:yes stop_codon:yes gene_type:complete
MPITNNPFESDFGFASPGFSVDANGNIVATSIQAAGAGGGGGGVSDWTLSDTATGFIFTGEAGENPPITIYRNARYTFNLDLDDLVMKIYSDSAGTTLYNTGLVHSDGTVEQFAQGKVDGQLQLSVALDAPNTLYYGNVDGTIVGTINIQDQSGVFGTLEVTSVTQSTSTTSGALQVSGGMGVAKNLHVGGSTTTSGLDIDGLGISKLDSTTNLEINATNKVVFQINNELKGRITDNGLSIPIVSSAITSSTIDASPIGATTPSTAAFTSGTVANAPTINTSMTNKTYVDVTSIVYAIALGS